MKNNFNNERGAALIMVLLTIALIMLFSTVMMNSILSNAKQNDVMDHHNRATHIAEMGATYVKEQFKIFLEETDVRLNEDGISTMVADTQTKIEQVEIDPDHPDRYFELDSDFTYENTSEGSKVSVNIIGHDDEFSEDITLTFNLKKGEVPIDDWESDSETPPSPPSDPDYYYDEDVSWKNSCPIDGDSTYVIKGNFDTKNCSDGEIEDLFLDGQLTVKSSDLTVNGTAVLNGVDITTLSKLIIKGNAYINSVLTSENNPNSQFLACGHARFKETVDYKGNFGVRGYVIADKEMIFSNNPVVFGNDAILKGGLMLDGTDLEVDGDLTIHSDRTIDHLHTGLGGDIFASGDITVHTPDQDSPFKNPDIQSFHPGADVTATFPDCHDAPPLEQTSEPVVEIEDGSY
ncbi:hypothetical protein ACTWQB_04065 [Piscibacillus sp. B03]|uniref:hypothetical protein n=1 Tax=Piscibacillus sp. B03 TaxID=3457430 RepID=UPI003FCD8074